MGKYDFSGWATRNDLECSDGRIIRKDAFKHNDGQKVPLVWGHQHNDPLRVLGHALLENRDEGVYVYGKFNDTESGQNAKLLVEHGDVVALSIYANQLQQNGKNVLHGAIREVSLVLAGANPGAYIENVISHGDMDDEAIIHEEEATMYFVHEDGISLYHEEDSKEENTVAEETKKPDGEKTVEEIIDSMTEEQKEVMYYMVGEALAEGEEEDDESDEDVKHSEGGDNIMKSNVFDQDTIKHENTLTHEDQAAILSLAKQTNVGSLKLAMEIYAAENDSLAHGFETEALEALVPDYKNITPGAPEILRDDQSWVMKAINKIHKSPYSRIRTRYADARIAELKAKGYQKKGDQKRLANTIKLIGRTFDPQTIYIRDDIHNDDIIDITEFDYVSYMWNLMKANMYETLALAALIGDGRDDIDPDKIKEEHVCPIWTDKEEYTIHADVDVEAMRNELQGTDTNAHFGENFVYAEAVIQAALYAREKYKGTGKPDFYCTPHLVNVMLLARDFNGRRIYESKADLAKALNVGEIHEIEQFAGKTRTTEDGDTKKLLGIFVNLADYQFGSTKGGEITKFSDFDIDFNKHKYLMETRISGALVKLASAIALEEPVTAGE